jgi:opacity protein-like surface antigen
MKKIILLIVASLGIMTAAQAQKIKVESGELSFLKDVTEISVVFVYPDDMKYGKKTLQEYVNEKVEEKEKKQEGSGEKWKSNFFADRERFNEKFIHTLGKYSKSLFVAEDNSDFKYTMIVKTTFTEPGFQFGFQSKASAIDLEINFIETNAPDNVIASIKMSKASGAAHPDSGERVAGAYSNGGAVLGKYLKKKYL